MLSAAFRPVPGGDAIAHRDAIHDIVREVDNRRSAEAERAESVPVGDGMPCRVFEIPNLSIAVLLQGGPIENFGILRDR